MLGLALAVAVAALSDGLLTGAGLVAGRGGAALAATEGFATTVGVGFAAGGLAATASGFFFGTGAATVDAPGATLLRAGPV
jgi:hypothetical protein